MLSEFRQDLVSGDWVLFATGRTDRPHDITPREQVSASKDTCPFEHLEQSGNPAVWMYPAGPDWTVALIQNKYPAVQTGTCGPTMQRGVFAVHQAIGAHDVFVFRDHDIHPADLPLEQTVNLIRAYKKRYQEVRDMGGCTEYILIFHNFGKEAGASIAHPHSQILSTPIVPPDVSRSLHGAQRFYEQNKKRVYDVMIEWEKSEGKRVVFENDFFIAFCPYVSRNPYEVRIFAKDSHAHFERMPDTLDAPFAEILNTVLKKIKAALGDPAYNFFIHTAPAESSLGDLHQFYAWHVEILPKIKIDAGFEIGTGIDINPVDPDEAASRLRQA